MQVRRDPAVCYVCGAPNPGRNRDGVPLCGACFAPEVEGANPRAHWAIRLAAAVDQWAWRTAPRPEGLTEVMHEYLDHHQVAHVSVIEPAGVGGAEITIKLRPRPT